MEHPSKKISPTYQFIIIAGIIILFLQLYSHAVSMFNDSQTNLQVERFLAENTRLRQQIRNDIVDTVVQTLPSIDVRRNKIESERGITVLPGERVFIVPNSDVLALDTVASNQNQVFRQPELINIDGKEAKLRAMKQRPVFDQWMWFLFQIE